MQELINELIAAVESNDQQRKYDVYFAIVSSGHFFAIEETHETELWAAHAATMPSDEPAAEIVDAAQQARDAENMFVWTTIYKF